MYDFEHALYESEKGFNFEQFVQYFRGRFSYYISQSIDHDYTKIEFEKALSLYQKKPMERKAR